MMKITIGSWELAKVVKFKEPTIVISITEPHPFGPEKKLTQRDNLEAICELRFGDFYHKHFEHNLDHNGTPLKHWAMTEEDGQKVSRFLDDHKDIKNLFIHCEAGVSRSPSMAMAIAEHLDVDLNNVSVATKSWDHQPMNPWVYEMTKKSLKKPV